jgi:transcriptional regulator with XRE-family HTH domain/ribosomal protein S18 acetylase RimI-like enzyme
MNAFTLFLNERRKDLGMKVPELAAAVDIHVATLRKYLSGERPVPIERVSMLRYILCQTEAFRDEFDLLYNQTTAARRFSPLEAKIDSSLSNLRVATLVYPPFAGPESPQHPFIFVDTFVDRMMRLAAIHFTPIDPAPVLNPAQPPRFALKERLEMIDRDEADLLFSLISLQRMRKLSFLSTPIRIGINGLILFSQRSRIRQARELLIHGNQPSAEPFRVLTVRHEVGHVFMESHKLYEEESSPQPGDDPDGNRACLVPVDSLDAGFLAARFLEEAAKGPVMLVADEHSLLSVLKALQGEGQLVLPPNSDQAVIHSAERRIPPAYYFGIGLRRVNNPLIDYMTQTLNSYLSLESEVIASWLERLYYVLVSHVQECLSHGAIYVGGLRRTTNRLNDPAPPGTDPVMWRSLRETMLEQNARAYARRCLSLSSRSLDKLPVELNPWRQVLTRARERIQVMDGGNRARIRNIIFYCAHMVLGMDPLMPDPDPMAMLKRLVPRPAAATAPRRPDPAAYYASTGNAEDHWEDFLFILQRELDMDLKSLADWKQRGFHEFHDLGNFISRIQKLLEATGDSQMVLNIRRYRPGDLKPFHQLLEKYKPFEDHPEIAAELPDKPGSATIRFMAYNLGAAIGFIDAEIKRDESALEAMPLNAYEQAHGVTRDEVIHIHHLHVVTHMQDAGVARRLLRSIIEEGNNRPRANGILLILSEQQQLNDDDAYPKKLEIFKLSGFSLVGEDRLWYEFKREQKTGKPQRPPLKKRRRLQRKARKS